MRITTQMLNESARKAGLPIHQNSLLDYVYKTGNPTNPVQQALQSKASGAGSRSRYEKQEKAADELSRQVQNCLFEKHDGAEGDSELCKDAKKLTEKYNSLLAALDYGHDALDAFYKQSLKEVVSSNRVLLEEVGITASKGGKLQVDSDKMKFASPEKMREVFGEQSEFMEKLRFLAGRVADHAGANVKSASGNYSQSGYMNYFSPSRFDFFS